MLVGLSDRRTMLALNSWLLRSSAALRDLACYQHPPYTHESTIVRPRLKMPGVPPIPQNIIQDMSTDGPQQPVSSSGGSQCDNETDALLANESEADAMTYAQVGHQDEDDSARPPERDTKQLNEYCVPLMLAAAVILVLLSVVLYRGMLALKILLAICELMEKQWASQELPGLVDWFKDLGSLGTTFKKTLGALGVVFVLWGLWMVCLMKAMSVRGDSDAVADIA